MAEITEERIQAIADRAAKGAINELLLALGVNASNPESVLEMQADFLHLRRQREACAAVRKYALKTTITAFGTVALSIGGYVLALFWKH